MELKRGYKQTEVGVIPDDWDERNLTSFSPFVTSGSRGWADYYAKQGSVFVRITNLSRESIYVDLTDLRFVKLPPSDQEGIRTQLQDGDLLISITADIGIIGFVDSRVPKPAYINQHIALVRFEPSKVESKYLAYFLAGAAAQKGFLSRTDRGAKAGMNLPAVGKIKAAFPPLPEQRAIAGVLGDVDALIGALDRLIAKKRDLKQAAMQQLLTGQTRLPGFSGKWAEGRLSDVVAVLEAGVSVNSVEDDDGTPADHKAILKTSAVVGGRFLPHECKRIAARDLRRAKLNPRRDTLLISRMNTHELVGECGYVAQDYPNLFVPDRLWMTRFRPEADINARWLAYLLSTPAQRHRIGAVATGTSGSMKNLSKPAFLSLNVLFPSGGEQTAIAAVLSDMDAELSDIEKRRDKTRLLKQGMMQELLTGRIRLS